MQDDRPISVLILYSHPLLGEGLADLLAADAGLEIAAVRIDDAARAECAIAAAPQVIILERGDPDRAVEMLEMVPDALIIDVAIGPGPTFAYRRDEIAAWPDAIIEAIHRSSARRTGAAIPVQLATPRAATRA